MLDRTWAFSVLKNGVGDGGRLFAWVDGSSCLSFVVSWFVSSKERDGESFTSSSSTMISALENSCW